MGDASQALAQASPGERRAMRCMIPGEPIVFHRAQAGEALGCPNAECIAAPRCHSAGWSETNSGDVWERLET